MGLISSVFKTYYYENTYLPPVDLSEKALAKHLLESENQEAAERAKQLISTPDVQTVLSEPLSYHPSKIDENNKILENRGFKLLSMKPLMNSNTIPYYSVVEHAALPNFVIKSGAIRVPEDMFVLGPMNDTYEMAIFNDSCYAAAEAAA